MKRIFLPELVGRAIIINRDVRFFARSFLSEKPGQTLQKSSRGFPPSDVLPRFLLPLLVIRPSFAALGQYWSVDIPKPSPIPAPAGIRRPRSRPRTTARRV